MNSTQVTSATSAASLLLDPRNALMALEYYCMPKTSCSFLSLSVKLKSVSETDSYISWRAPRATTTCRMAGS
jgi:hypothetical protein